MALVDLHLSRCKGRRTWTTCNWLIGKGVKRARIWGCRKKGKVISFKTNGMASYENKEATFFVGVKNKFFARAIPRRKSPKTRLFALFLCGQNCRCGFLGIASRRCVNLAPFERIFILRQYGVRDPTANRDGVYRRMLRESAQNRVLRAMGHLFGAARQRDARVFFHSIHRVVNKRPCCIAHQRGGGA